MRSEQSAVKSAVDEAGRRDAVREQTKADMDALSENIRAKDDERAEVRAAVDEYSDAVDEHRHSVNESVRTQAEANQLRRRAEVIDHSDPA